MGVENGIFWSEIGSGFGEPGGTPLPRIPRCTPPPPGTRISTPNPECHAVGNLKIKKQTVFSDKVKCVDFNEPRAFDKVNRGYKVNDFNVNYDYTLIK